MPAPRGVKRAASKSSASTATAAPKNKKKKNVVALEIPTLPRIRGCVLTCGQGDVGQLGLGEDVVETSRFKLVTGLGEKIVDTCAGGMHTIALDSDGQIWTFGCNDEGALGRATSGESEEGTPGKVSLPLKAVAISAGDSHTAALLENGDVYAWGSFRDSHGSMGLVVRGREGKASRDPVKVAVPERAAGVASGSDHLVVLTTSGAVYTLGCGEQGQLGRLSQRSASRDTRAGFTTLLTPGKVILKQGASRVWAGYHATFVLDATADRMHAFGLNNYSQLGITGEKRKTALYAPTECDAFTARGVSWKGVAAGQHHSIAVDTSGTVYAVGRVEYGRLGLGDRSGDAETLEPIPKLQGKKVVRIAAGTSNSFAVTDAGEILAWGMGSEGQLGTGGSADANEPTAAAPAPQALRGRRPVHVSAGGQHTVLLVADPNAVHEPSPSPEKETEEEKVEDEVEEKEPEPKKVVTKGRGNKRGKKQEQEEEVSSTSSAQPSDVTGDSAPPAPAPPTPAQKVNGDEKKETPMEVDETDSKTDEAKDDMKMDEGKQETDTSSQDSADSEMKDSKPDTQDVEMKDSQDVKAENADTKSDALVKKSDAVVTKPDAVVTKTDPAVIKPEAIDTKSDVIDKKSDAVDTKSDATVTKSDSTDAKSEAADTKIEVNGAPEETKIEAKTVETLQTDQVLTSKA